MNLNQTPIALKEKKLCTLGGIKLAAILGGPLAAFYFISKNFNALGNNSQAQKNLFYGFIFFTLAIISPVFLPSDYSDNIFNKMPPLMFIVIYVFIISAYARYIQGNIIKEGLLAGIKKYSVLKVMGISILFLVFSAAFVFISIFFKYTLSSGLVDAEIGYMYHDGVIVQQNDAKAAKWLRKAAEKNMPEAQNNLGALYHEGKGVRQSDVEAIKWIRKAADQGNMQAQLNLAQAYHSGTGVPQDNTQAMLWLKKAAAQGSPAARDLLQTLNQNN